MQRISFALSLTACRVLAAVAGDEVKTLPGWEGPLPSKIYSGYLDSTPPGELKYTMHMHYIFFESERDPANDPVLVWSNGGPGAGSEFGLFTELGPLGLSDASLKTASYNASGIPSLFKNDFAWTKVANVLMYDAPPPVGFSYCNDNVDGDGYSCGDWDDYRTAKAVHTFIENWMQAYPEYASHDLYLSGESYAGVYIPMLAREILEDPSSKTKDHLKGMAIGDGCVGYEVLCGANTGPFFDIEFLHGHGQVSDKLYGETMRVCGLQQLQRGITDSKCQKLVDDLMASVGGFYDYNLYDECGAENVLLNQQDRRYWSHVPVGGALNDYPCGGVGAMLKWLNTSAVQSALHIPVGAKFFLTDNGVGFNYSITEPNLMPFYDRVIHNKEMRVLIYNGDTDPGINSFVSQNWTVAMGFKETEAWRPWTLDGKQRVGGYVTRYEGNFDFLTIRGSGHMVPEYKPAAALEFITRFLNNQEYQQYKQV